MPSAADIRKQLELEAAEEAKRELEAKQRKEKLRWMQLELAAVEAEEARLEGLKRQEEEQRRAEEEQRAEKERRRALKRKQREEEKMAEAAKRKRTEDDDDEEEYRPTAEQSEPSSAATCWHCKQRGVVCEWPR